MKHEISLKSGDGRVAGVLTITTFKDGAKVRDTGPFPNKVVTSDGYGRNLIARQLAGDATYPIHIDSAALGDDDTAAADGDTALGNELVADIPITNATAVDDVLTIDVFVADANLPDDTYEEFGVFCDGRLFARVILSSPYTKVSGEDTLFTYTLNITG